MTTSRFTNTGLVFKKIHQCGGRLSHYSRRTERLVILVLNARRHRLSIWPNNKSHNFTFASLLWPCSSSSCPNKPKWLLPQPNVNVNIRRWWLHPSSRKAQGNRRSRTTGHERGSGTVRGQQPLFLRQIRPSKLVTFPYSLLGYRWGE